MHLVNPDFAFRESLGADADRVDLAVASESLEEPAVDPHSRRPGNQAAARRTVISATFAIRGIVGLLISGLQN